MSYSVAEFAAFRRKLGRGGPCELHDLFPHDEGETELVITVDLVGLGELVRRGKIDNVLITAAMQAADAAEQKLNELRQSDPEDEQPGTQQAVWEAIRKRDSWQDSLLGAFIISPHYYLLDELDGGSAPEDGLCYFDFAAQPDVLAAVVSLAINGWQELSTFREFIRSYRSGSTGQEPAPEAEQLVPGPSSEPPAELLVRSGNHVPVDAARKRPLRATPDGEGVSPGAA